MRSTGTKLEHPQRYVLLCVNSPVAAESACYSGGVRASPLSGKRTTPLTCYRPPFHKEDLSNGPRFNPRGRLCI